MGFGEALETVYGLGYEAVYVEMAADLVREPHLLASHFVDDAERMAIATGFHAVLTKENPGPEAQAVWRDLRGAKGPPVVQALHDVVVNAAPEELGPWRKVRALQVEPADFRRAPRTSAARPRPPSRCFAASG